MAFQRRLLFLFQFAPLIASLVRIPYIKQRPPIATFSGQTLRAPTQLQGWFTTKDDVASSSGTASSATRQVQRRPNTFQIQEVGSVIGSGSYGTVHYISVEEEEGGTTETLVGKRPWTISELQEQYQNSADNVVSKDESDNIKDKASRCQYYFTVEKHCLTKLMKDDTGSVGIPRYKGTGVDSDQREWMLFDPLYAPNQIDDPSELAMSLQELIELDRMRTEQLNDEEKVLEDRQFDHHLYYTSQALLGSHTDHSLVATLDVLMEQLLQILQHVHTYSIVHRDVKPANLLVAQQGQLVLIDFGSAGDLSTAGLLNQNIGLDMNRVAISPIYAAPEVFLDSSGSGSKYAANFDCFSVALLFCQLLFQYLDERTESGFHQQLANQNVPWDLDSWLQSALQSKVRPSGLVNALQVLKERPGLWKLLQDMLLPDPSDRLSSTEALQRWNKIVQHATSSVQSIASSALMDIEQRDPDLYDGAYLLDVLESLEACEIPTIRPLHFVTSFDRSSSLGLFLSEVGSVNVDEMDSASREQWLAATADAVPGEVFIQEVIPGGQADKIGVFAVGDRLLGVGEIPLAGGGFVRATELIQDQPKSAEFITLHFDRKSAVIPPEKPKRTSTSFERIGDTSIQLVDQGAWSIKGRRQAQEDAFILHEVLNTKDRSVVLAGVFDGHLGSAAADFCREDLPVAFAAAMNVGINGDSTPMELQNTSTEESNVQAYLELAWNQCCDSYRSSCQSSTTECLAEYDPKEGILMANTGSQTAVAGTTATVFALDQTTNQLAALNCGDSRGIVLDGDGQLLYQTVDHKPESEMERLTELGNSPRCAVSRWTVEVGQYDYAVARSLEGPLATSRGIISDADVTVFAAQAGMTVVVASDGVWDVMDTAEVQQKVTKWRRLNKGASDIARALCSLAYEKGSSDNMSVVVLCLE